MLGPHPFATRIRLPESDITVSMWIGVDGLVLQFDNKPGKLPVTIKFNGWSYKEERYLPEVLGLLDLRKDLWNIEEQKNQDENGICVPSKPVIEKADI